MSINSVSRVIGVAATALAVSASVTSLGSSYLLISKGSSLPGNLVQSVRNAGGVLTTTIPQIGLAVAESGDPTFRTRAGRLSGIAAVVPNARWVPEQPVVGNAIQADGLKAAGDGSSEPGFSLQWALQAIDAPGAWAAGQVGVGARVAVLDSGIAAHHPDAPAHLNLVLSTSFVPGEAFDEVPLDDFNHGTHVAGIIAAPVNGIGTAGVANEAEIVAVKVLSAYTGSGSFGGVIQGIVYAADIQADVINMSLGAVLPRTGFWDDSGTPDPSDDVWVGANEVSALLNATSRATGYAYQHGTVVIASAGNEAIDRNHDGSLLVLPADCTDVIAIAATGPVGWGDDPTTNLDLPASYSNYGQSRISLAAPGGDFQLYDAGLWYLDMVLSPGGYDAHGNFAWYWAAGTSMAAPHATAVAALIIGKHGGKMQPAQVAAALRASADDLGKPGNDPFYGAGRVNAASAVQ